ncbi:acetyltransferase [Sulfuriflexus mobilis]|uniref:acetyltransferase n=1 Tax=Sulfuriflexus mobilis TaxID=1811807 RepID=UPI000F83077C|nr:acetyltransferase [Sulfuriflexus mobilis]
MTKLFVIWGCAGHAKVLVSLIKSQGGQVVAFFDNNEVSSILPDVPIYFGEAGFNTWLSKSQGLLNVTGLVAIGGHRGSDRIEIQHMFRSAGLKLEPLIHPNAFVCNTTTIGEGSQVLAQAVVAADSRLGDACIINHKASVDHECVLGDGVHLAPGATVCGCVTIGDNVMIGAGSVVLPRLKIGPGSIIGAGAVVTKDVPDGLIIVGNPGRPIF